MKDEVFEINCENCDNWEEFPADMSRHKAESFEYLEDAEDGTAYYKCSNGCLKRIKSKLMVKCNDCCELFEPNNGRPYKYEPSIWLCDSCHDERMEED